MSSTRRSRSRSPNVPRYGCLNVVGTWTLTTAIVFTESNISIYGQPGSVILTGASNIRLLDLSRSGTLSNVTLDSLHFDGRFTQSAYSASTSIYTNGTVNLTIRNCTFTNQAGQALFSQVDTSLKLFNNTMTYIGDLSINGNGANALLIYNVTNLTIDGLYGHDFSSGDAWHVDQTMSGGGAIVFHNINPVQLCPVRF